MKKDERIRASLEQNLSGLHVSRQQQLDMIDEITGGTKMQKKIPFSIALAAVLVLMSITALAVTTNLFDYFGNRDARFGKLAEQAANVTAEPVDIESDMLGDVSARIDSAYYDGRSLSVGFVIENSTRIEPYTPDEASLAEAQPVIDPVQPLARTEDEQRIMDEFSAAVESGTPFGYAVYTVYASDHTLVNGIDVPPYVSVQEYGADGEYLTIRSYEEPLPDGLHDLESVDVSIRLYESVSIHYFDGAEVCTYAGEVREAGEITASVPRSEAEIRKYAGEATIEGVTFAAEATLSAMSGSVKVTADQDVTGLVSNEHKGETLQAPEWKIVVLDEHGCEYDNTDGYSLAPDGAIEISVEGSGELPGELHIFLLHAGEEPDTYEYWPSAADNLDNPHIVLTIAE